MATSRWFVVALIAAGVAAYANSLGGVFVFDDQLVLFDNPFIRSLWPLSSAMSAPFETPVAGRPLAALSFAVNYAMGGASPFGYHLWNIGVHLGCALLLFAIVERALERGRFGTALVRDRRWLAFLSALVWLVHPLQTEVVDYTTQRTESMMALCYLATFYASLRVFADGRARPAWSAAAVTACFAGALCKEPIATAPFIVLVYDAAFVSGGLLQAARRRPLFYGALFSSWILVFAIVATHPRPHSAGFESGVSPWVYALNQAVMIVRYLRLSFWPSPLVLDYGLPRAVALGEAAPFLAVIATLVLGSIVLWWRSPPLAFLGTWFFVTLAPASSFIPVATEVGAERRMYLPLAAIVILVVVGGRAAIAKLGRDAAAGARFTRAGTAAVVAASLALVVQTRERNREYRDPVTLWNTVLERLPNGRARTALAVQLMKIGRTDEALREYRAAIADYPDAHYELGVELDRLGQRAEAIEHLDAYVRYRPMEMKTVFALNTIGRALFADGRTAAAADAFTRVLTMRPDNVDAKRGLSQVHSRLGLDFVRVRRSQEALAEFTQAVEMNPDSAPAQQNLANSLAEAGELAQALEHYRAALTLSPQDAPLRSAYASVLLAAGQKEQAIAEFENAVRLDPKNPAVQMDLAAANDQLGPPTTRRAD